MTWDLPAGTRDDLYFGVGYNMDSFGPGQRVGFGYKQLAISEVISADDSGASVAEVHFWQSF